MNYQNNQKKILNYISIVCALIIPLLITGPFLPDLIISSFALWFLYYSLTKKMFGIYSNHYFYFFIAFCFVCVVSSLMSDEIILSLKSSLFYFRIGIFALLISYLINKNNKILDYFYYAFFITFACLIVDGYVQYLTRFNLIGAEIHGIRVSSFFGDELILGSYLSRLSPLFFALFIYRKNKNYAEICSFFIILLCVGVLVFLTGERASFVLFVLSFTFIFIFISQYKLIRLSFFIIFFSSITLIVLNDENLYERFIEKPIQSIGINDSKKFFFSPAHDSLIKTGINMFFDRPIIGHGPKMFRVKCKDPKYADKGVKPCDIHPHNFYIQLLAETGIIGFSFLAGLFFYFIYLMMRHIKEYFVLKKSWLSDYQICLFAGLLITIWPLTTNGNIFTNNLMMLYSLQMGFFKKEI